MNHCPPSQIWTSAPTVVMPSRFAVDYLFLRRMLAQENMRIEELDYASMTEP